MSSSLEMNKIAAAVLTAGVVAMTAGFVAKLAIHPEMAVDPADPAARAYAVALPEGGVVAAVDTGPTLEPVLPLLAAADLAAGEKVAKKCTACHTFDDGGANKIGPNLWNSINRPIASVAGFGYSDVLQGMSADVWTYESMNAFLAKPKDFAPGTKMTFAGLRKVDDRAAIIAYMRSLSGAPADLPTQEEIDAVMGGGAEAEGEGDAESEAPASEETPQEGAEDDSAQSESGDTGTETTAEATAETTAGAESETSAAAGTEPEAPDDPDAASAATESPDDPDAAASDTQMAAADPIGTRLAAADPAAGESAAKKCKVCHTFEKGGKMKVGPNLYNVVGGPIAGIADFNYSKALQALSGDSWSYANLDAWLAKPKDFARGTRMAFPGIKDPGERAALIAFLRQHNDNPPPLP